MFIRQPDMINDDLVVCTQSLDDAARLPIPEDDVAATGTRRDVLAIGRETNLTGITSDGVSGKPLLLGLLEAPVCRVDQDLVVERLAGKIFV